MKRTAFILKSLGITLNSCDISPGAKIGKDIYFCHTVGIVIGSNVVIGDNVTIYQNVTLGTKDGISLDYPIIENNVMLFAGCVIAGSVRIGENSIVGANSVVLKDIPPDSIAVGIPAFSKSIK